MSPVLIQQHIEGVWHSGIVVHETEYYFAGGIAQSPPHVFENQQSLHPKHVIPLGVTDKSKDQINELRISTNSSLNRWIRTNNHRFTMENYRLIENNCNHFSDAFIRYLTNEETRLPDHILNQHQKIASTPMGATILNLVKVNPTHLFICARSLWMDPLLHRSRTQPRISLPIYALRGSLAHAAQDNQ